MSQKRYYRDNKSLLFMSWLHENRDRFNHRPYVRRKGIYICGRYDGIIPEIQLVISENDIDVRIDYHRVFWDILRSISVIPEKDLKNGFYCTLCEIGPRVYYDSIGALYKAHTFNEILEWSNEWIRPGHYLVLERHGRKGGITTARIVKQEDLHQWNDGDGLVAILSLRAWKGED